MRALFIIACALLIGWYIDSQFYDGRYFRAVVSVMQRIATSFGARW
jgi:hypothetical protein